jgi:hypothetical protein
MSVAVTVRTSRGPMVARSARRVREQPVGDGRDGVAPKPTDELRGTEPSNPRNNISPASAGPWHTKIARERERRSSR